MPDRNLDVVGIGNAIVDVLAKCDDAFLATHNIPKGSMRLIDRSEAEAIHSAMGTCVEDSGGSAANSMACIASLGGAAGFIGKVAEDRLGQVFREDMARQGVEFTTPPAKQGSTGRCLINVTPDAERSMQTHLGVAGDITIDDIDPGQIEAAKITFFEGYLFEIPVVREAFIKTCEIARKAGRKTALTLSDKSCVERQHRALIDFIASHVDILLANEAEAEALFETDDFDTIIAKAGDLCPLTAITRNKAGSVIIARGAPPVVVAARKPVRLEDTTGAGDGYAGGFLYGLAQGYTLDRAGAFGSLVAAEVISHMGPRPQQSLSALAGQAGV